MVVPQTVVGQAIIYIAASVRQYPGSHPRQYRHRREKPLFFRPVGFAPDVGNFPVEVNLPAFRRAAEPRGVHRQFAVFLAQLKAGCGKAFLAELHQRFIRIHPVDDGNERVARLLMNYILIHLDFLPMVLQDRNEYIEAIEFADTGDASHLENLFANSIAAMLEKGIRAKNVKIELNGDNA